MKGIMCICVLPWFRNIQMLNKFKIVLQCFGLMACLFLSSVEYSGMDNVEVVNDIYKALNKMTRKV